MAVYNFRIQAVYDVPEVLAQDSNFQSVLTTDVYFDDDLNCPMHIKGVRKDYSFDKHGNRVLEQTITEEDFLDVDEFWMLNLEEYTSCYKVFHNYVLGELMETHYNYMQIKIVDDKSMLNISVKNPMEYEHDAKRINELSHNPKTLCSGVYKGYEFKILSYGSHPCAYIRIPNDGKLFEATKHCQYTEELLDRCHGGITFVGFLNKNKKDECWIGWDYAHGDDYKSDWGLSVGKQWMTEEILNNVRETINEIVDRY